MAESVMKLGLILSATDKMSRVIDQAVGKSTEKLKALENQQKKFAVKGAAGGALAAGGFMTAKSFLSAAGQVERYKAVLKTMLGTQDAAEKRFKEMANFAKTTPFDMPGVVEMGNQLQAIGIYSKQAMTMVGDLAAASGKPLEQVLGAVAKLKSGQKGEAVNMFRDLLISNDDWVKATGKGVKANGEMMASTEEMIAALPKIMKNKGFSGMMKNLNDSYEGMLSNMEDANFQLKASWGELLLPLAKKVVPGITSFIGKLQELGDKYPFLVKGVLGVTMGVGGLLLGLSAFGFMSIGVVKGVVAMRKGFAALKFALWATKFHFVTAVAAMKAWSIWSKIAAAAQWLFSAALWASPITWIVIGIMAVIAAVVLLVKFWKPITAFFKKLWDGIKSVFSATWNWIKKMFLNYTPHGLIIKNWSKIYGWFSSTIKKFKEFGKNVMKGLWEGIKSLVMLPIKAITAVADGIKNKFKSIFGIHSPSKVFAEFGVNMNAGLSEGLEKSTPKSIAATRNMAKAANDTFQSNSNTNIQGGIQLTYSPSIVIGSGSIQDKESFTRLLKEHKRELVQILKDISSNNARISFA